MSNKPWADYSKRYRDRNPEYREREKQRMQAKRSGFTLDDYARERERVQDYRARQPVADYITNLRSKRRRQLALPEGDE